MATLQVLAFYFKRLKESSPDDFRREWPSFLTIIEAIAEGDASKLHKLISNEYSLWKLENHTTYPDLLLTLGKELKNTGIAALEQELIRLDLINKTAPAELPPFTLTPPQPAAKEKEKHENALLQDRQNSLREKLKNFLLTAEKEISQTHFLPFDVELKKRKMQIAKQLLKNLDQLKKETSLYGMSTALEAKATVFYVLYGLEQNRAASKDSTFASEGSLGKILSEYQFILQKDNPQIFHAAQLDCVAEIKKNILRDEIQFCVNELKNYAREAYKTIQLSIAAKNMPEKHNLQLKDYTETPEKKAEGILAEYKIVKDDSLLFFTKGKLSQTFAGTFFNSNIPFNVDISRKKMELAESIGGELLSILNEFPSPLKPMLPELIWSAAYFVLLGLKENSKLTAHTRYTEGRLGDIFSTLHAFLEKNYPESLYVANLLLTSDKPKPASDLPSPKI